MIADLCDGRHVGRARRALPAARAATLQRVTMRGAIAHVPVTESRRCFRPRARGAAMTPGDANAGDATEITGLGGGSASADAFAPGTQFGVYTIKSPLGERRHGPRLSRRANAARTS